MPVSLPGPCRILPRYGGKGLVCQAARGARAGGLALAVILAALGGGRAHADPGAGAGGAPVVLSVLGDSLTAGYGLPADEAFPARLGRALAEKGHAVRVVNAGVSGDTSAGGLARLDWVLGDEPQAMIVELGANDGLRGLDPVATRTNLDRILRTLRDHGVAVLLAGMKAPPNMGREYAQVFDAVYPQLAADHDVVFYPFFLEGVALNPALNQADGMHPNAQGVDEVVARILPAVETLLDRVEEGR
ncbi:arylesterase [Pararhodospirillum oryzae]|uniref:Arylesterase n=1 Tax=Pararhodospirillum oryzae TaxID=478448 RepID=A0A512H620_9PROT|nr:arylesterase [Pararhodospirillum oryzae]GEO80919.1 arylesterase [Pararhodospirillum oryzae]